MWVNGDKMAVNNRSLTALSLAGMEPTNTTDVSGNLPATGNDSLPNVLGRLDEMVGNNPSNTIGVRSIDDDRSSPIAKTVSIKNGTCPTCGDAKSGNGNGSEKKN
jgi:hypothetical protein